MLIDELMLELLLLQIASVEEVMSISVMFVYLGSESLRSHLDVERFRVSSLPLVDSGTVIPYFCFCQNTGYSGMPSIVRIITSGVREGKW